MVDLDFQSFDFSNADPKMAYQLISSSVIPRPIAWVSTCSLSGVTNLAPFSYFTALASQPPLLGVSITSLPKAQEKDTLRNVRETGELVIQISPVSLISTVHETGKPFPPDQSEIDQLNLETIPSIQIRPPRVKNSPIQFECKLDQLIPLGASEGATGVGSCTLIVARILHMHVAKNCFNSSGQILAELVQPLSRLGGPFYSELGKIITP